MKLFLDDVRPAPDGWHRVPTVAAAKALLTSNEKINEISLDHDLGEGQETGYDLLKWIERQVAIVGFVPPPIIKIHSANPVGKKNMEAAIERIKRFSQEIKNKDLQE